jgi:hypothetical protein
MPTPVSTRGGLYANITAATAAVTNRFVTSANMKVGAYTLANATAADGYAHLTTATVTKVTENDTMGRLIVVGLDINGKTVTDVLVLNNGDTASGLTTGVVPMVSRTSITGAGWVDGGTPDTIVVGYSGSTILKAGAGVLRRIILGTTAAGSITVYDNIAASGTKIATLKSSIAEGVFTFDAAFSTGLTIVAAAASDFTVVWE